MIMANISGIARPRCSAAFSFLLCLVMPTMMATNHHHDHSRSSSSFVADAFQQQPLLLSPPRTKPKPTRKFAFVLPSLHNRSRNRRHRQQLMLCSSRRSSSSTTKVTSTTSSNDAEQGEDYEDPNKLLKAISKSQLIEFCNQFQLSTKGTKQQLLLRLQNYGKQQVELQKRIRKERVAKVEGKDGMDSDTAGNNSKERYEIVDDDGVAGYGNDNSSIMDDDEEDESVIYFPLPPDLNDSDKNNIKKNNTTITAAAVAGSDGAVQQSTSSTTTSSKKKKKSGFISSRAVTAPPPPPPPASVADEEAGENKGERTVTIYSTKDQNDLTGVAAAQPGQMGAGGDPTTTMGGGGGNSAQQPQPWDMQQPQHSTSASSKEMEQAKEVIVELVRTLLSTTGAPAYSSSSFFDDDNDDLLLQDEQVEEHTLVRLPKQLQQQPDNFVGFNPSNVPTDLLSSSSRALLRVGRHEGDDALEDVLRQFELQAIGYDGAAGDDIEKGGGHYREVTKVRAFLLGYRRAQLRKQARQTTTLLLDKLVVEGIEGLDLALSSMTRGGSGGSSSSATAAVDDGGGGGNGNYDDESYCWELNDSLLDFLNDAIRQHQKKIVVEKEKRKKLVSATEHKQRNGATDSETADDHLFDSLWNVETQDDGQRIEAIDPNDPKVLEVLQQEQQQQLKSSSDDADVAQTPSEKLLLLLKLLRERLKAEAAFNPGTDEKGRNLRLLAYCLQVGDSTVEQEKLIMKEIGNSLDRMDSFLELVASSIEYGESTTHQLQPTYKTKRPLDLKRLRRIHDLVQDIRTRQRKKAQHFGGI